MTNKNTDKETTTNTELATIDEALLAEINELVANDIDEGTGGVPKIGISREAIIRDKAVLVDAGAYTLELGGELVYFPTLKLQILNKMFRYVHITENKETKKFELVSESMYEKSLFNSPDFLDTNGTRKCGRILGNYDELSDEDKDFNSERKLVLDTWALASGEGITADGEKVNIIDQPVLFTRKGKRAVEFSNFFRDNFTSKEYIWLTETLLTETTRDQVGGNVFYVPNFAKGEKLKPTQFVIDQIKAVAAYIDDYNNKVFEQHKKALQGADDMDVVVDLQDLDVLEG